MVAKIPTSIDDNRSGSEMLGVYEREIRMYQQLLPDARGAGPGPVLRRRRPESGLGEADRGHQEGSNDSRSGCCACIAWLLQRFVKPEPRGSVLILEDLAPAEIGDQVAGRHGRSHRTGARGVGPLPRCDLGRPGAGRRAPGCVSGGIAPKFFQASFLGTRKKFLRGEGRNVSSHMKSLLDRIRARRHRPWASDPHDVPQCLLHGDLRLDNMFFEADDVRALIDWQLTRIRTGGRRRRVLHRRARVDPVGRPSREIDDLLARYHAALVEAGVDDYSLRAVPRRLRRRPARRRCGSVTAVELIDMGDARGRDTRRRMVARLDARLGRIAA